VLTIDLMERDDWEAVRAIYQEGMATGNATLETCTPDWTAWDTAHLQRCRLVARAGGDVVGWAALSPVSKRQVYAGVAEVSIYVKASARGKGVGRALLNQLIRESERHGFWTLQAGILAENQASIALHRACGFRVVGRRERIGQLKGVWRDVIVMERRSSSSGTPVETGEQRSTQHMDRHPRVRVAVVQAAPVLFDCPASVEKACLLVDEAASQGAQLILFPEAFIPAYPRGLGFGTLVGSRSPAGRRTWHRYWANAIDVPGPETEALGAAARQVQAYLVVGVIERDSQFSAGTLYCTLLYFGPAGQLLGKHRKLKPTGAERLIWGEGDGSTLTVLPTEVGRIGGLICWENYMPLARMALYGKGVDIYLAPTADARDTWQATLRHIACEGRCFVLGCNQYVTKDMYPADLEGLGDLADLPQVLCRGGSAIVSPLGDEIAGPLYGQEGTLYADLDLAEVTRSRFDLDVVGHYARPDVFQLTVNERPAPPLRSL
jgi:nitrilase